MTENYNVIYSPDAKEDLKSLYRYIAFNLVEPAIAEKQVNRIRKSIKKLNRFPQKHQEVSWEPWSSMGMKYVPVDNYVVYYLVNDDSRLVTIVRIFYGGRNVEDIISK